ncbi:MAG: hypothetical protein NTX16_03605 [Actinobacteria bacterium]|nr:hypothetical protein [Actinomycetota bacterium]
MAGSLVMRTTFGPALGIDCLCCEVLMSDKSVAQKAHIKSGTTIAVVNPVPGVVESLGLPPGVTFVEPAAAGLVFVFVRERAELDSVMRPAARALASGAALWVFFRKGSSGAGRDMSRDDVWNVADSLGMRPLGLVSIDDTWTAFRLRCG